jgi:integrase
MVSLLEEYVSQWRSVLLNGRPDPGTLFLDKNGRSFDRNALAILVGKLALVHGGRRVTPHIFRDIFAFRWLDDHPHDYLTLSKLLWHRNVNTTIRIYGSQFDYSHALMRAEEWFDKR